VKLLNCAAVLLLLAVGACTSNIESRPTSFDIREGSKLRGSQRIALQNTYQAPAVVTIMRQGQTRWEADLKSLTDTAVSMLGRHMGKEGIAVDSAAAKTIALRVSDVTAMVAPFANRASLTLEARLGNGATRSARIHNTSADAQRAVDGAVVLALTELLKDEQFLAYVNGQ